VKLDEIIIHQFRGLKDLALSGLSRVNLLVGPNDSGKTRILEAVAVFSRPFDLRMWIDAAWRREVLHPDESFLMWMEWMFPHGADSRNGLFSEAETRISGSGTFAVKEAKAHFKRLSRVRTTEDSGEAGHEQAGALFDLSASYESDGERINQSSKKEIWEGEGVALSGEVRLVFRYTGRNENFVLVVAKSRACPTPT
jgi:hypothetical protein